MLPDRVSNPGLLTYESGALPIALRGPALSSVVMLNQKMHREYLLLRDEYQIYFIDCDENISYLTSA